MIHYYWILTTNYDFLLLQSESSLLSHWIHHNVTVSCFRSVGVGTSSAAARIGSMSAPYINWLVCISFRVYSPVLSVDESNPLKINFKKKFKKNKHWIIIRLVNHWEPRCEPLTSKVWSRLKKGCLFACSLLLRDDLKSCSPRMCPVCVFHCNLSRKYNQNVIYLLTSSAGWHICACPSLPTDKCSYHLAVHHCGGAYFHLHCSVLLTARNKRFSNSWEYGFR